MGISRLKDIGQRAGPAHLGPTTRGARFHAMGMSLMPYFLAILMAADGPLTLE